MALGIAMAAAEVWNQPVLLIDGNFSHPQVCEAFGLPDIHGLGDLLAGGQDVKSVVQGHHHPAFAGDGSRSGAAQSHQYAGVACLQATCWTDLAAAYPLIIIDGPSINGFPESVLYAAQVDRVLMVVKSGITRVQVVSPALARLAAGGCDQVDLILNRRTFPIPPWIYQRL